MHTLSLAGSDWAHLVEGTVLVELGEGVLLQEVILQEAGSFQDDLVLLSQRVLQPEKAAACLRGKRTASEHHL